MNTTNIRLELQKLFSIARELEQLSIKLEALIKNKTDKEEKEMYDILLRIEQDICSIIGETQTKESKVELQVQEIISVLFDSFTPKLWKAIRDCHILLGSEYDEKSRSLVKFVVTEDLKDALKTLRVLITNKEF